MSVRGIFASHSGIVGDRQADLSGRILRTMPGGMAPLLALSAGMPTERAKDTAFSWIEDSWINGNTAATQTVNSAATQFTVEDTNIWVPNSVIMSETTGEYMLITAISGLQVTVIRGLAGTTPAAVTAGDRFQSIGTGYAEGTGKPNPVAQRGHTRTNYVQIFKNGWAITGTATAIDFLTGSQLAQNRQQCLAYHAEDIERAFIWGRKDVRVLNGKQFRLSDGIIAQIEKYGGLVESANANGNAGEMNLLGLHSFMRRIFDRRVKGMPNERIAFTGSGVLELLQHMALLDGVYNIQSGESEWGIRVTKLNMFSGTLNLVSHPMMVDNALWNSQLYVLHPGLIKKRVLRDSWSEEFSPQKMNNNGLDATEGYIAIEQGFELKGAETCGILRNIQTASASQPATP